MIKTYLAKDRKIVQSRQAVLLVGVMYQLYLTDEDPAAYNY